MSESVLEVLIKLFLLLENIKGNQDVTPIKSRIFSYLSRFGLHVSDDELNSYYSKCCNEVLLKENKKERINTALDLICRKVESELLPNEKILILFCLFEYAYTNEIAENLPLSIAWPVADRCFIDKNDIEYVHRFITTTDTGQFNDNRFLVVKQQDDKAKESLEGAWIERNKPQQSGSRKSYISQVEGAFVFLHIPDFNIIVFKYIGEHEYYFRNTIIQSNAFYFFENQDTIIHHDEIILSYRKVAQELLHKEHTVTIVFSGKEVEYSTRFSVNSIKRFTFSERSGNLVGVIGESLFDKTLLFQCLAGNLKLSRGNININGFDTYNDKYKLQGIIGYIPDIPLMFNDLSVYDNFYYHAKLHYRHIDQRQTKSLILRVLNDLGLQNLQHLQWNENTRSELGNYQVKLLNLGIEMLRDPYVVLFTEPFKGLQTGEIQKFIRILRELCLRGKLVIITATPPLLVNIREFDRIWILDRKGYPIYNGAPDKAFSYFREKLKTEHNIKGFFERKKTLDFWQLISEKEVNKKGEVTEVRKVTPETWHKRYLEEIEPDTKIHGYKNVLPRNSVNIPDIDKQFAIYFFRDVQTRIRKLSPYLKSIVFTVTLALLTGFFGRYQSDGNYYFSENHNLLFYLFASTFNAFILGIWTGREEIRKEFEVVERDSILLLSKYSYLNSKYLIITFISILLMGIYVLIANGLVGMFYMSFKHWLVLSAVSIAGVLVGLNISLLDCSSRSINFILSTVVFFQVLFSGKVIPYENFPKPFNNKKYVNILGDLSIIRWGFEAMVVDQFKNNKYQEIFFTLNDEISDCNYEINYHLPYLDSLLQASIVLTNQENPQQALIGKLVILQNELQKFANDEEIFPFEYINWLSINDFNPRIAEETVDYITYLQFQFYEKKESLTETKQNIIDSIGEQQCSILKSKYHNIRISDEVTGAGIRKPMIVSNNEIIRNVDPVFHYPDSNLGRAHLYAPYKKFNGQYVDTLYFNIIIILLLSSVLYVSLMAGIPEYISRLVAVIENSKQL